MKSSWYFTWCKRSYFLILGCILFGNTIFAQQQKKITDFTLLSGPDGTGTTLIGSSITLNGGVVGAYKLIQTTGNVSFNGTDLISAGKITLTNSNIVNGKIAAGNSSGLTGTILSVGSSAVISGNIDVNGNIVIGGGIVSGTVTLPVGKTYTGPVPAGDTVFGPPSIPVLPIMPPATPLQTPPPNLPTITNNQTLRPGFYGNINYSGNKTLTLDGPGTYYFSSFYWSGNSNKLVFNFKNQAGSFIIYVYGDADFGKLNASISSDGNASRIYFETQGTGSTSSIGGNAFVIANGSSGSSSKWMGTVYAPNGGINIGSGTGSSALTGTLASRKNVSIQSGVTVTYAPLCSAPPNISTGMEDRPLAFTTLDSLIATSTTPGVSFNWQTTNGGIIASNPNNAKIYISAAGTYIVTVSSGAGCFSKDTVIISARVPDKIGAELRSIYENRTSSNLSSTPFFSIQNGYVLINVIVNAGYYTTVLNLLQTSPYGLMPPYGLNYFPDGESNLVITGLYPIVNLLKLNLLTTQINYCRTNYQAFSNVGIRTSAGDTTIRTRLVRSGYNINGDGIKIGVISDSYSNKLFGTVNPPDLFNTNTVLQDIKNGDLPGDTIVRINNIDSIIRNPNGFLKNVHVLQDFPQGRSDEGRAMLQIIHDVAPGAELYFRTGFFTSQDFAKGIKELEQAGCNIIVDDMTYMTEPFLKDGVVAKTVDSVVGRGVVSYFSAAGNFADLSYEKESNFVDASSIGFTGKKAHNFGNGDLHQSFRLRPGNYVFVLQWLDGIHSTGETGTQFDIDFYLTKSTNGTGLIGFNRNNTSGDPFEFIPIKIVGTSDTDTTSKDYNLFIINNSTTGNPARLKFIVFKRDAKAEVTFMKYNEGKSTLVGQANAAGAIAVGAARFDKAPPYLTTPLLESFSSIGGSKTYNVLPLREKPYIVAPDGVNTTVGLGPDYPATALDGFSNFFGTSAAAPHAAAAAALIMEGRKNFLNQNAVKPAEIKTLLKNSAIDMETPGFDFKSGFGLINIDMTMRTFAAPRPFIDSLKILAPVTSPPVIPGQAVFTLLVKGENFSNNSIITYDTIRSGTTIRDTIRLATTVLSADSALAAMMPKFNGNPPVRMYTPPYPTTNGKDGGYSNAKYFFGAEIVVQAVSTTKKYGEEVPDLDTIITINGKLLQDTSVTLSQIGLTHMTLTTGATDLSGVGTYLIIPKPVNSELLPTFGYKFIPGLLTVAKMPVKVTPNEKTVMYGKHIGNVTFKYEFDQTKVLNPQTLHEELKTFHEGYVPNNALAVVRDFTKTQKDGSRLDTSDLRNLSMIATLKAVNNSRKFRLEGDELIPLTDPNTFNVQYLVDVVSESIYDYNIDRSSTNLYEVYPGINKKGLLGASALANNTSGEIDVNGTLVQMVNGTLVQMVNGSTGPMAPLLNGELVQVVNGQLTNGTLVQLVNGTLVQLVNGELQPIPNLSVVQFTNGTLVQMVNGTLVQLVNNQQVPIINGADVTDISAIPNGTLVQLVNGTLVQMVNGTLVQMVNGTLVQLVNGTLVQLVNGTLVQMVNRSVTGTNSPNNNTAIILDEDDAIPSENNWLGPMFGTNMITGLDVGTQWMVCGILPDENFDITYGLGKVTITNDPCLLTHAPFKNFGNTTQQPTSLWLNLTAKVSGQLTAPGDYLLFKKADVTFNFISSTPLVNNNPIPDGKIVADNIVSAPTTHFDAAKNTWITRVPVGFASTSDIFVTGGIINSSTGFQKINGNTSSVVKGKFISDKTFSDQWGYAIAAYQLPVVNGGPYIPYSMLANEGNMVAINGNYRAGTPLPILNYLVQGASGGGGNNYTGSSSSFQNFTACMSQGSSFTQRTTGSSLSIEENQSENLEPEVVINPNPASGYINVSFVPSQTGKSKIEIFTITEGKVFETDYGFSEAGNKYIKQINVSKLVNGIYLIRVWNGGRVTNKKIIISR